MPLQGIEIPESIKKVHIPERAAEMIDAANERIEAFMLADVVTIERFVPCDFHLLSQSLDWILENHLLAGNRFCELGSGFGVGAMLADMKGMESIGIEIEERLVDQSCEIADEFGLDVDFFRGSFVPREAVGVLESSPELKHIETHEDDVYDEIGLEMCDFDLFFAFPWPGEQAFFEAIFSHCAADGSLLLTYLGREGMNLLRKV